MTAIPFQTGGVVPATLLAFDDDMNIDEKATRSHLSDVAGIPGVRAIVVNGHASEVHACGIDERKQILDFTLDEIGGTTPVIAGIYSEGGIEAGKMARSAQDAGASALLVFPPNSLWMGSMARPEMAVSHFRAVTENSDLPIILFQYATTAPISYPVNVLNLLLDTFPQIVGVKDFSNDAQLHENNIRTLQSRPTPVTVYTTHSGWFLGSLAMGPAGLISGAGSVIARFHVELFEAMQRLDLAEARKINERIAPLNSIFYRHPHVDMHNRMKEALVLLGKLPTAAVRPPLMKLSAAEIEEIRAALVQAELLDA